MIDNKTIDIKTKIALFEDILGAWSEKRRGRESCELCTYCQDNQLRCFGKCWDEMLSLFGQERPPYYENYGHEGNACLYLKFGLRKMNGY